MSIKTTNQKHQPRKRFGQNFLHDQNIINQIVDGVRLQRDDWLVEIGPGMGALTEPLLKEVDSMTVIELDTDLSSTLRIRIGANAHDDFTIIESNAMHVDYREIWAEKNNKYVNSGTEDAENTNNTEHDRKKLRVVGNLPYNISTPILFRLLDFSDVIVDMHFMLQKEVVDRITAEVGSKIYGRLSIIMQYFCHCDYLLTVPNGAFNPPPKVTSAVFRLTPHVEKPIVAEDEKLFTIIVRECFNHRRKTLRAIFKKNALLPMLTEQNIIDIEEQGISVQARPETLTVTDFVILSNFVKKLSE